MKQWNHNNHYHPFLLRHLPSRIDHALDIGCGLGEFASRLAERAGHVDAVDIDAEMIRGAQERQSDRGIIQFIQGNFAEMNLPTQHYQVVSAIAVLHHMELTSALQRMAQLLAPHGTLIILGLYREETIGDFLTSAAGVVTHNIYSRLIYRRNVLSGPDTVMPVQQPSTTLSEIRTAAEAVLPGARIRRHLLWRYSIVWQKP